MSSGPFLGTSEFAATVLERLAASDQRPELVVTLPDRRRGRGRRELPSPVAEAAERLGIEVLKSANVNDVADRERILAGGAGWGSICAFGQLIREPLLSELPLLNVHPSLLPRWRGAAPIERAIMSGDTETGVSVMRLVAGLDSGPVALTRRTPIGRREDFGELAPRLAEIGGEMLVEALGLAARGEVQWTEQDEASATYAEKVEPHERLLDPALPARDLELRVRALNPHVGTYLQVGEDERLGVRRASTRPGGPARGAIEAADGELLLGCGEGALSLEVVQAPGKRAMDAAAYLSGNEPPPAATGPSEPANGR